MCVCVCVCVCVCRSVCLFFKLSFVQRILNANLNSPGTSDTPLAAYLLSDLLQS